MGTSIRTGAAALHSHHSTTTPPANGAPGAFTARVTFVLYDEQDKDRFKKYGGYEGIGTIECVTLVHDMQKGGEPIVARPHSSNQRKFPLVNEIVEIIPAANTQAQNAKGNLKVSYYYGNVVGIWDSPEHNATPDESYLSGSSKPVTGERFQEKGTVRKLMHTPGDITYESRFGSSIRMGGTHESMKYAPWTGDNGKPVVVVMNNQKLTKQDSWLPTFEDINGDGSSIYMLSGHFIPFIPASLNFASHRQTVNTKDKSKFIVGAKQTTDDNTSANNADKLANSIVPNDAPPAVNHSDVNSPAEEEIKYLPEYEDNNFSQELEDLVPLTNGIANNASGNANRFAGSFDSNSVTGNLKVAERESIADANRIAKYAGQVSTFDGINLHGKALLDLISVTEGTMGRGHFNGYDFIIGGYLLPGFDSWSSSPPHPNIKIPIRRINSYSSATGRYQFIYAGSSGVWKEFAIGRYNMKGMSKYNQDFICWKRITTYRQVPINLIDKMDSDFNIFTTVIDKISYEYASLPNLKYGNKGAYGQAGQYSFEVLFSLYKKIYAIYVNQNGITGNGLLGQLKKIF